MLRFGSLVAKTRAEQRAVGKIIRCLIIHHVRTKASVYLQTRIVGKTFSDVRVTPPVVLIKTQKYFSTCRRLPSTLDFESAGAYKQYL